MAQSSNDSSPMTVQKAGKKGGDTTFEKYGPKHYSKIGKKGGAARSDQAAHDDSG